MLKMKKFLIFLAVLTMAVACKNNEAKDAEANADTLSEEVVEIPEIELKDFEAMAANYVDKEITTKGIVDHVCRHGGKRLFLVTDDADLHIDGEERFDEDLNGSEIKVTGIVREFRVDEAYCLKMEEENLNAHNSGELDKEQFEHKNEQLAFYRDSMKVAGVDHLSFYSMDYLKHEELK
jgi:hypothetical protein